MAKGDFNTFASPKAKTERFKIYAKFPNEAMSKYELQGKGITDWSIEQGQDVEQNVDVLGFATMDRKSVKAKQSIELYLRKDSHLAKVAFEAFYKNDMSVLDNVDILQKFEFADGDDADECLAREQKECLINITSFMGEAENYLKFAMDFYYSNQITTGTMPKVDADPVVFTPDKATP